MDLLERAQLLLGAIDHVHEDIPGRAEVLGEVGEGLPSAGLRCDSAAQEFQVEYSEGRR